MLRLSESSAAISGRMMWARTRADMQYRLSFVLRVTAAVLSLLGDLVVIWAFTHRFGSIGGWTLRPLLFTFGTSSLAFRLSDAFLGGAVERCAEVVRNGQLDSMLTRPVGVLWQLMGETFAIRRVMQLLAAVPLFVIGVSANDIEWTWLRIVAMVLMIANGALMFGALFTIVNTLSFWSPTTIEIANAFTYGGQTVAQYPLHVMDRWIRVLTFSVIPVAFAIYLPSFLILTDVPNPMHITSTQSWLSLLVGVPLAFVARWIWRAALRRYRSTGS
jgi:ABC-2 type transport system permease protein